LAARVRRSHFGLPVSAGPPQPRGDRETTPQYPELAEPVRLRQRSIALSIYVKKNNSFEQAEPISRECPHCGSHTQLIPLATPSFDALSRTRPRHAGVVFACAACNEPRFTRVAVRSFSPEQVVLSSNLVEVERSQERFQYGYLPTAVERLFTEALECYTANIFNAFGIMCRRAVQAAHNDTRAANRPHLYDLFQDVAELSEIDATTRHTLEVLLFTTELPEPEIGADEAAVLIEIIKDMFYQRYVRAAKLKAAMKMRRFFAGETTQKITPIAAHKRRESA
jgi:hypothetical protein